MVVHYRSGILDRPRLESQWADQTYVGRQKRHFGSDGELPFVPVAEQLTQSDCLRIGEWPMLWILVRQAVNPATLAPWWIKTVVVYTLLLLIKLF